MITLAAVLLLAVGVSSIVDNAEAARIVSLYDQVCVRPALAGTSVAQAALTAGLGRGRIPADPQAARVAQAIGLGSWTVPDMAGAPVISTGMIGTARACYLLYSGPHKARVAELISESLGPSHGLQPVDFGGRIQTYESASGAALSIDATGRLLQVSFVK